jgi:hypothetical protein
MNRTFWIAAILCLIGGGARAARIQKVVIGKKPASAGWRHVLTDVLGYEPNAKGQRDVVRFGSDEDVRVHFALTAKNRTTRRQLRRMNRMGEITIGAPPDATADDQPHPGISVTALGTTRSLEIDRRQWPTAVSRNARDGVSTRTRTPANDLEGGLEFPLGPFVPNLVGEAIRAERLNPSLNGGTPFDPSMLRPGTFVRYSNNRPGFVTVSLLAETGSGKREPLWRVEIPHAPVF